MNRVGPVLHVTPFAWSVVAVIEEENTDVLVRDEGAYLRVLVPRVCRLSRAGLEAATGLAVQVGARVAALAQASEVLVTSTVQMLVLGSGISFADRGLHTLKGVPDRWQLYAVEHT